MQARCVGGEWRLGVCVFLFAALAAPPGVWGQTSSAERATRELNRRFADIEREVERLGAAGDSAAAQQLATDLKTFRGLESGDYALEKTAAAEVHVVGLESGGAAPPGVLQGKERFTRGYAEVKVTHTAAPVVLALTSQNPLYWKVVLAPGVRLQAVVLAGSAAPQLMGVPKEVVVHEVASQAGKNFYLQSWGDRQFEDTAEALGKLTGCPLVTCLGGQAQLGQPIIVGPENRRWREQHLYLQLAGLHERATRQSRAQQFAGFEGLRFRTHCYRGRHAHGHDNVTVVADFTVHGPIASSMHLLHDAQQVIANDPEVQFASSRHGELVVYDPAAENQLRVPLAPGAGQVRLGALAFDSKRRRLIVGQRDAPHGFWGYRLQDAQWESLGNLPHHTPGMIYVPELDEILGVSNSDRLGLQSGEEYDFLEHRESRPEQAGIHRFDPTGKLLETVALDVNVGPTFSHEIQRGTALAFADGKLFIVPPPYQSRQRRWVQPLHIVDWSTKRSIYSGEMRPHDGQGWKPEYEENLPAPKGGGALDHLFKELTYAERSIEGLQAAGDSQRANKLAELVAEIRRRTQATYPSIPSGPTELHVCSAYNAQGAVVQVTHRASPLVLVLSAYDPSNWKVEVADGVKLERVIVGGYHLQQVQGVPPDVPLDILTHDGQSPDAFYLSGSPDEEESNLATMRRVAKLEPTTRQVAGESPPRFVVGETGGVWRGLDIAARLQRLHAELPPEPAEDLRKLEGLRFTGIWEALDPPAPGRRRQRSFGQFTPRGPIAQTLQPIDENFEQASFDSVSGTFYGRRGGDVFRYDPRTNKLTPLPLSADVPAFSWPSAFTLDSRRRRLLLSSFGGGGYLYACDLETERWSIVARPGLSSRAMVYVPEQDCLYALSLEHDAPAIARFNPHGAPLEVIPVDQRLASGRHTPDERVQLAWAEGKLIAIHSTGQHHGEERVDPPQIYVIDPKTGKITPFGAARLHPGEEQLSNEQLDALWEELAAEDADAAQRAAWRLAAGGEAAVQFVAAKLPKLSAPSDQRVQELIAQLDDDQFELRQQAFEELAAHGSLIAAKLEEAAKSRQPEVRSQARRLLAAAKNLEPVSNQLRRELQAIFALELMSTTSARELLTKLAQESPDSDRGRAATEALKRLQTGTK